jgi:hypothetical protein|mmetsp:Transcript_3689/g.5838  ORF Transcript_3689/g.5838 Transcript_3689/m.5838 type:complete len:100 (-) Transcript_3689:1194-1493(-)
MQNETGGPCAETGQPDPARPTRNVLYTCKHTCEHKCVHICNGVTQDVTNGLQQESRSPHGPPVLTLQLQDAMVLVIPRMCGPMSSFGMELSCVGPLAIC